MKSFRREAGRDWATSSSDLREEFMVRFSVCLDFAPARIIEAFRQWKQGYGVFGTTLITGWRCGRRRAVPASVREAT